MSQSNWTAIADRITAQIATVPDIGKVYNRRRLAIGEVKYEDFAYADIGGEKRARVWMVDLPGMTTQFADPASMQWDREAAIEGFLQIEDAGASALTATALAESIIRVLAADLRATKLGGTVLFGKPPRIETNAPRFFGIVACHFIRLIMPLSTIEQ